jgi:hypothetical protein
LGGVQPTPFLARGTIEPLAGRYRLTLLIERHSARGTRVIESDDCTSLAKAATIVLGLLVRKEKTLGRELSESEISGQPDQPKQAAAQAAKPPEPAEPPKPVPPPAPVPEAPQPMQWLLRAPQGHLDFSTLPHLGYGVGLGIGIEYRSWRALMSGAYFGVEHVAASATPQYQVDYRRKSAEALGCYGWRLGPVEAGPCIAVQANHVSAHATGDRLVASDKTAFWLSLGGGISGYLHVHRRLALVATINGRFTTERAQFLVSNPIGVTPAHRVPLVTTDASLGCEWSF